MATRDLAYTAAAAIAVTSADALGDGSWCGSALVDNQTNEFIDAQWGGSLQAGTLGADGQIDLYLVGSWDGTDFTAGCDAGDAAITWGTTGKTHVHGEFDLIPVWSARTDSTDDDNDIYFGPFGVAEFFGGKMPREWGIIIENNTGASLHATGTNNHLEYTGIKENVA